MEPLHAPRDSSYPVMGAPDVLPSGAPPPSEEETGVPAGYKARWYPFFESVYEKLKPGKGQVDDTPAGHASAKAHAKLATIWDLLPGEWFPDRDVCERVELLAAAAFRDVESPET